MNFEMPLWETKRLWIRPVEEADAADLFAVYKDPRVLHGSLAMRPFTSLDEMLSSIKNYFMAYHRRGVPQAMVMELKTTGMVIGIIDFHSVSDGIGELGYLLHHAYWKQGYMKEAVAAMVYLGFRHIGFYRIEAWVDPGNIGSCKALTANGFQKEGILRKYKMLNDGKYHDLAVYSILQEEFQEVMR